MRRRIFHVPKGVKYHVGNSLRGIRKAIRGRWWAIDLDMQITKADPHCRWHAQPHEICRGHIVGTHWGSPMKRDGFRDPLGLVPPGTPINRMTLDEVLRLETTDKYKIARIERLLKECGPRIIAYLEPKGDPRFEQDWPWRQIKAAAAIHKTRVRVRSIRNLGGKGAGTRRVSAAKRNGFTAKTIY